MKEYIPYSIKNNLSIIVSNVLNGFPAGSVVKNLPANAGDAGDMGSIPESGISPEKEMATHSSILAWSIPWIE